MLNEFEKAVNEKIREIQQEVYIKDKTLQDIVVLLLSIKNERFPSNKPPRGLLFYGPPGTGKTLLMKTLAKALEFSDPIIIRGPEIISQYYGKSESRLRHIFMLAKENAEENNLAIIFMDELDSIAADRGLASGGLEPRLVGQLLSLMDGLEKEISKGHVVVIGSTNRPEALDLALRRPGRFDWEIEFDLPTANERKEILKILLNDYVRKYENINLDKIAKQTIGFTGADLLQLLNETLKENLLQAMRTDLKDRNFITQEALLDTLSNVKPSALRQSNIIMPRDRSPEIENKNILDKIKQLSEDFSNNPFFKPVLLSQSPLLNDKIASTIAYTVRKRLNCPYLVHSATRFKSKWFGETDRLIREFFEKIKRSKPAVIYIKNLDAITISQDEHLYGAVSELSDYLAEFSDNNTEVLLLCSSSSATHKKIDPDIKGYFEDVI